MKRGSNPIDIRLTLMVRKDSFENHQSYGEEYMRNTAKGAKEAKKAS